MTEKPDDISQEAWDAARHALSIGFTEPIESFDVLVLVATALSAAEARGREAATEECAKMAEAKAAEFTSMGIHNGTLPVDFALFAAEIRKGLAR